MPSDPAATLDLLVRAHHDVFDGLLVATDDLDADGWATPTGCPGWDVHDQLAHCVGIERRLLGDEEVDPHVQVADAPHLTDEVKRHLERDVAARRGWDPQRLREEAQTTFARRREELAALRPQHLAEQAAGGPLGPMRRSSLLRMRLFDLGCHERDVRAAVGRLDGFAGAHLEVVTEQALRGWAGVWARSATGHLRLVVAGAEPVTLDLAAGRLTRGGDGPTPDATLALTVPELLALASGRSDAPAVGDLEVTGDRALVGDVLGRAALTP